MHVIVSGGGGGASVRGNSSTEYRVLSHRHKGELAVFPPKRGGGGGGGGVGEGTAPHFYRVHAAQDSSIS